MSCARCAGMTPPCADLAMGRVDCAVFILLILIWRTLCILCFPVLIRRGAVHAMLF